MSVVSVTEIHAPRSGSFNEKGERTYQRSFRVRTNNPYDEAGVAIAAVGIARGDSYPTDSGARCKGASANCESDSGLEWVVSVDYGRLTQEPHPLERPPEVSWSFVDSEPEIVEEDVDGKPCVNKAGDKFDPPLTRVRTLAELTIVRNEASFDAGLAIEYRNLVNSGTFYGFPKHTAKLSEINGVYVTEQVDDEDFTYAKITYKIVFNPNKWRPTKILNAGFRELDDDGKRQEILIKGVPISSPVPLDDEGKVLDEEADPVSLEFALYEEADFNALGLE